MCYLRDGLVLLAGRSGSGRTTSIMSLVDSVLSEGKYNIVTLENPCVEYNFGGKHRESIIQQYSVGDNKDAMSQLLSNLPSRDADIVCVDGWNRSHIKSTIDVISTGKLVFATAHANSCTSMLSELIYQSNREELLSLSCTLRAVVCQVMLESKQGGIAVAFEVFIIDSELARIIREGKAFEIYPYASKAVNNGNLLLNDSLIELMSKKVISSDIAFSATPDRVSLQIVRKILLSSISTFL